MHSTDLSIWPAQTTIRQTNQREIMATTHQDLTVIHVDHEHAGIRYSVLLILVVAFFLSFLALDALLAAAFPSLRSTVIFACFGALVPALIVTGVAEWVLKRTWRSGRRLEVSDEMLALRAANKVDRIIDRKESVNDLWWHFPMAGFPRGGRERRVPAKWSCLAGQFQQDEARIVVYCYAPPKRSNLWLEQYDFQELDPETVYDTSFSARVTGPTRPEIGPEIIAGPNGRYWLAERYRWREGVELTPDGFERLLQRVGRSKEPSF